MLRRPFLIAIATLAAAFAFPAFAANPQVEFDTTAGKIRVELYPDAAPKTVANFLDYVKAKHFDGTQFHRVIAGFMIQGGGFTAGFHAEADEAARRQRGRAVEQGGSPQRAGDDRDGADQRPQLGDRAVLHQRLRQQVPQLSLAGSARLGYTVFGKVVSGMDVVDKIAKAPTGSGGPFPKDVPVEKVIINKAVVVDAK